MLKILHLHLKTEYFDQIRFGQKGFEYRLADDYWTKRLKGVDFQLIELCNGYPVRGDWRAESRLLLPWRGYTREVITHPHFGSEPVEVFAIKLYPLP